MKENISKFERIASGSKVVEQKEDYKAVSVKDMKRRFEAVGVKKNEASF